MKRRALRSKKCKDGLHQGKTKTEQVKLYPDDPEPWTNLIIGCRWHGCGCYCHPWFEKRTTIQARGLDGRRTKTTFG